ncbi:hypothetical protein H0H92_009328 [Tricholoma furcatifolium]|nr:hypothetical protein H0H92_009328 [Tricholoma furcatifolium]
MTTQLNIQHSTSVNDSGSSISNHEPSISERERGEQAGGGNHGGTAVGNQGDEEKQDNSSRNSPFKLPFNDGARKIPKSIEAQPTQILDGVRPVIDDLPLEGAKAPFNPTERGASMGTPFNSGVGLQSPPPTQQLMLSLKPVPSEFPLSPPRPSQVLASPIRSSPTPSIKSDSESDLEYAESLMASLRKPYRAPSLISDPTKTLSCGLNGVRCPPSPSPSIKRDMTDSPCIPSERLGKKPKFVLTEEEERNCLLISDSDEEAPAKSMTKTEPQLASQLPRPTPKPKPKRKSSGKPASTQSTTVQSRHLSSRSRGRYLEHSSYRKHDVFWHLDGNLLVQIEKTRFRLHRSVLARQSKWFEEKFSQREEAAELVQADDSHDIPLYDLSGKEITAEDFEAVLLASEDTMTCFHEELPFEKLNSLLRTSTILGFTIIEKYAANALSNIWSADLEDVGVDKVEHPIESLALARQCALFPVIKRTLYELVRLSNFGQTKIMPGDVFSASEARLGAYDKDILLSAREHLSNAWRQALDVDQFGTCASKQSGADGSSSIPCTATNHTLSLVAHYEIIKERGISNFEYDPVCGLQALAAAPWKEKKFCDDCVAQRQRHWLEERKRIWRKLDEWFEV